MRRKVDRKRGLLALVLSLGVVTAYAQWSSGALLEGGEEDRAVTLAFVKAGRASKASEPMELAAQSDGAAVLNHPGSFGGTTRLGGTVQGHVDEEATAMAAAEVGADARVGDPLREWPVQSLRLAADLNARTPRFGPLPAPPGEDPRTVQRLVDRANHEFDRVSDRIDRQVERVGLATLADRAASALRVEPAILLEQSLQAGTSMGEVVIAHALVSQDASAGLAPDALLARRRAGEDWASIANDMGVGLDAGVAASRVQSRAVLDASHPRGRVELASGSNAALRAGLTSGPASFSGGAGVTAGAATTGGVRSSIGGLLPIQPGRR